MTDADWKTERSSHKGAIDRNGFMRGLPWYLFAFNVLVQIGILFSLIAVVSDGEHWLSRLLGRPVQGEWTNLLSIVLVVILGMTLLELNHRFWIAIDNRRRSLK